MGPNRGGERGRSQANLVSEKKKEKKSASSLASYGFINCLRAETSLTDSLSCSVLAVTQREVV